MNVRNTRQKADSTDKNEHKLRIETVYRRHSERAVDFFTDENLNRLAKRFWVDWKDLFFFRDVRAYKGARKSEVERARILVNSSEEQYMQLIRKDFEEKRITEKQYRTQREFVRDWKANMHRYKELVSPQETDYKRLIKIAFDLCRE